MRNSSVRPRVSVTKNPKNFSSQWISQTWSTGFIQRFWQYFWLQDFNISWKLLDFLKYCVGHMAWTPKGREVKRPLLESSGWCFPSFPCSPCSPCYPCSPNLLHVLQSGIKGFNEFCSPVWYADEIRKISTHLARGKITKRSSVNNFKCCFWKTSFRIHDPARLWRKSPEE